MSNNNTYKRPVLVWGNSFYINISLERFNEGDYEDFDLTKATDLKVYLICATHNTEIPLDYEILQGFNNVLRCFVDYRLLHTTSYGIVVEGYDEQDMHFRFSMLPKEGFLVVNNTSGMSITEDVQVIDVSGRVGWGIQTDADLTNYYTKSEVDNLIAEIEVEIGDTYTKEEITQLLTLYPTKEEVNAKFADYYTKVQTDNLLNQKANSSDLDDYYDKGQTDGLLNAKVDVSTLNSDYYNKNTVNNLLDAKADTSDLDDYYDKDETDRLLSNKADESDLNDYQELLVSGQNIKTINNESILGSGNIDIHGGGATGFQQVQADWDETDNTDPSYIQNKPDLSVYAETSDLATVATTGDYDDLSNKPTLFSGSYDDLTNKPDLSVYAETTDLATVATTGDYTDLSNTPDLTGYATTTDLAAKQDTLVSGTNIKTINNQSILGSGNIDIQGGGGATGIDLDEMQEVIGNALLDNDAKINNVQYNIIPEIRQSLNQRIDETNAAIQNTQSTVNDQLDALDDQLYTAAQALNDLKESIPEGGVTSFNGATGAVTYEAPVTSVNGMTGAVTYEAPVSSVNGQTGAVTIDVGVTSFNGATGAVTYEAPVTSVNGMTGAVTIQTGGDPGFIKVTNGSKVGLVSSLTTIYNTNIGDCAVIEGNGYGSNQSTASGDYSHSEGMGCKAIDYAAHAEGYYCTASDQAHAEGYMTTASGQASHAEGRYTNAQIAASHAEGEYTQTTNLYEHASGRYNESNGGWLSSYPDSRNTLFSVGNGTGASARHNAFEIRQNGDIYLNDGSHPISSTTNGLKIEVVSALPSSPSNDTIYIVQ